MHNLGLTLKNMTNRLPFHKPTLLSKTSYFIFSRGSCEEGYKHELEFGWEMGCERPLA
jgi:hypothetical protein